MRRPRASYERVAAWGAAAAIAYLAIALISFRSGLLPVRPLYDTFQLPQPYRFVKPPAGFEAGNQTPEPGSGTIKFVSTGSQAATISTTDGQAVVSFPDGAFKPAPGETAVDLAIAPLDPAPLGKAPNGLNYDGNAYAGQDLERVPETLVDAIGELERSEVAVKAFGSDVHDHLVNTARQEWASFNRVVTDWERRRNFEQF